MPRLVVFRHGKSDRSPGVRDHDRPLKPRGVHAAEAMGRFLTGAGWRPDAVVVSSAERARTTAELAARAGGWEAALEVDPDLYLCSPERAVERLRRVDPAVEVVVFTGHEPTCSGLVARIGAGAPPLFPTAAMAGLELDCEWAALGPDTGRLVFLVPPRLLPKR